MVIGLIAHFALAPFFTVAIHFSKRTNRWTWDLVMLIILGAIRGVIIVLCGRYFNLPTVVSDQFRVFNSAIAFPTWFIFFTVAIEAKHQYQREFKQLFKLFTQKEDKEGSHTENVDDDNLNAEEVISKMQVLTSKLGLEIQNSLRNSDSKSDYTYEMNSIQNFLHSEIRPTSKRLWHANYANSPQIFKRDLLRIVLLEQKLPTAIVLLCTGPMLFVGIAGAYGFTIALVQTCVATLPVLFVHLFFEICLKLRLLNRYYANLISLSLSYLAPIIVQLLFIPLELRLTDIFTSLILFQFALWFVFISLLIGYNFFYSLYQQRLAVISSLKSLLKESKYLNLMTAESKSLSNIEVSRYLHGEIQTGLTASVLLLQRAARQGDANLAREALESAVHVLMRNHFEVFDENLKPIEDQLSQIITGWSGIADVSISLSHIDTLDKTATRNVVELIGEGVANAVRHGKANQIKVTDIDDRLDIRIQIESNGVEVSDGKSGLGTELLNSLTNCWNFEYREGKSLLTFSVKKEARGPIFSEPTQL